MLIGLPLGLCRLWRANTPPTLKVRKVGLVQYLKSGSVLAVEWGYRRRAASVLRVIERIEPHSQVIHLDRVRGGVHGRIREGAVRERIGSRCRTLGNGERLDAE